VAENTMTLAHRLDAAAEAANAERRKSSRFPIEREVRYKTLNQRAEILAGNGKTLNISSSGVLFSSDHELPVGTRLELSISWPAQLNEKCLLNLVARGRITRHTSGNMALQIQQYEFRTQSRSPILPVK
jgi:PilZ domain